MAVEQEPYELAKSARAHQLLAIGLGTSTIGQDLIITADVTSKSAPPLMAIFAETFAALH